jgi:acetyl-CoA acetyltransferase
MSPKSKYAIVGIGYTPQGRVPNRTALSFNVEASVNAIKDAGLKKTDIDGLICYRHFAPATGEMEVTPYLVAQHLGITPNLVSQEGNCSRTHLQHAIGALEQGLCKYVLVVYGDNALSSNRGFTEDIGDSGIYGYFLVASGYALAARRAMHEFGTGPETWKEIAMSERQWANLNPAAYMHNKLMASTDYYASKWVVEPLRLFDCCLIGDGGRAYIITSLERARDLPHPPVVVMGMGQHNPSSDISQSLYMAGPTGASQSGKQAFRMAGITIGDIDACQIYDCFTYTVDITMQDYGFFNRGEGLNWFKNGTIAPGGKMPVNTSGGMLSEAYFMGLTPLTEGVIQLMGRGGDRQLGPITHTKKPEIILCSDNGAILQTHSTAILGRV